MNDVYSVTIVTTYNDEPQTPWLNCFSNATLLSLKLLLSTGQNISSKQWLRDLFLTNFGQCSHFIPPENTRKPLVLWYFEGI